MAILVNKGQRGFVLKEGLVAPGQQITVDQETAEKLSRTYPNELMLIVPEIKKVQPVEQPKEEPAVDKAAEEADVVKEVEEQPKTTRRKKGKKEVK
ncbi:MAG: hypothetical protein J6S67_25280 [Methanobrevibacter sp.]|nr:hypothetical protein [Methanobrevibacter sp.]